MAQTNDNITIVVNDFDYKDAVYITLTINCGFCCRYLYIKERDEMVENNQAFANIFTQYIVEMFQHKYGRVLVSEVNRSDISFFLASDKNNFSSDIERLYALVFNENVLEDHFSSIKQQTIAMFREKYKDSRIRALYKMMEFSDSIKCFNYVKFAQDLLNISFSDFNRTLDYVIRPQNSILIVAGRSEHISPFPILFFKRRVTAAPQAMLAYRSVNPFTEKDASFIRLDRIDDAMGCVKFFFTNPESKMTDKYLLLQMLGAIYFRSNYYIGVDTADASIIYWNRQPERCREKMLEAISDESVARCRNRLLSALKNDRTRNMQRFFVGMGSMAVHGVSADDYIKSLVACNSIYLRDLFYRSGAVITEAQLIQRKIESRTV